MLKNSIVFAIFVIAVSNGAKLPTYFKKCTADEALNDCIMTNIQNNFKTIVAFGDKNLKLASFSPMKLSHVYLQVTPELKASLDDVEFRGFDTSKIQDISVDLDDKTLEIKFNMELFEMIGKYDVHGRLITVPLQGSGTFNGTGVGMLGTYNAKLDTIDKDGKKYFKAVGDILDMDLKRMHYQLDNLFNGDIRLGAEMNRFMNENWRAVFIESRDALSNLISTLITAIINSYLTTIPISELVN